MGELRERRRVATPVIAAVGGMVLPALIYLAINAGDPSLRGWGIVMGTDTAFALGILMLAGGASARVRTFLLTLMIVDDVVALIVIAVAYTSDLSTTALLVAIALYGVIFVLHRVGVRGGLPYLVVAIGVWLATLASGIHPTIAGVAIGVTRHRVPAHPPRPAARRRGVAAVPRGAHAGVRPVCQPDAGAGHLPQRAAPAPVPPVDQLRDRPAVRPGQRRDTGERRRAPGGGDLADHPGHRRSGWWSASWSASPGSPGCSPGSGSAASPSPCRCPR